MKSTHFIDQALLDEVSAQAQASPRRRRNRNFHGADDEASHRLLNAMEPDSYIPPHCHRDATKDETIIALRGRFGVVFFDSNGHATETAVIEPGGANVGVNIPHGVFHSLVALEPASVFFESKAGPYRALLPEERAGWAPAEGDAGATTYLAELRRLFG